MDLDEPSARWTTLGSPGRDTAAVDLAGQPASSISNQNVLPYVKDNQSLEPELRSQPKNLEDKKLLTRSSGSPIRYKRASAVKPSAKHAIDKPRMLYANQQRDLPDGTWHISNECNVAVFGSREGEVSLEMLVDSVEVHESFRTHQRITSIQISEYPGLIACGHQNGEVSLWNTDGVMKEWLQNPFEVNPGPITGVGFALSATSVLIFTKKLPPVMWNHQSGARSRPLAYIDQEEANQFVGRAIPPDANDRAFDQFAISPDGELLAIKRISGYGEERTTVTVVDINSGRKLANAPFAPDGWTTELAFSRAGDVLAYTTAKTVVVWNHMSKRVVGKFGMSYSPYENFTFSQNGRMLAAILNRQAIHFWTIEDGINMVQVLDLSQFSRVRNIVFTPDDTLIGVGVKGWSKNTRTCALYEFPIPK